MSDPLIGLLWTRAGAPETVRRVKAFMDRLSSLYWLTAFPPPCGSLGELARGPLELLLLVHQWRGVLGLPPAELLSSALGRLHPKAYAHALPSR